MKNFDFAKFKSQFKKIFGTKSKDSEIVESIIEDLEFSITRYKDFYKNYDFDDISVNMVLYVDNMLEILSSHNYLISTEVILCNLKLIVEQKERNKILQYYTKSSKLLNWLINVRKIITLSTDDDEFIKIYKLLNIPHKKQPCDTMGVVTIEPVVDYRIYMENYYIPEIRKLKNTAEELIKVLK